MIKTVFEFEFSISYLIYRLSGPASKRGAKKQISDYLRIQPAYLSQIISRKHNFTIEQADLLNTFWLHNEDESHFFILLVSKDRAGTASLKHFYQKEIQRALQKRQSVSARLGSKTELSSEAKGIYYSSWVYPAIHIGCTIPHLRNISVLAQYLHLSLEQMHKGIEVLERFGLIRKNGPVVEPTENWVRLEKNSPHIVTHHSMWRHKAIENLEYETEDDLHFSGLYSMDKDTAKRIKNQILELMKSHMKEILDAKEEDLYIFTTDLFRMKK